MESQTIKEYEQLEKNYWWFVGRRKIIERILRTYFSERKLSILDWGCGPGANFAVLGEFGHVLGVDASNESVAACQRKGIHVEKAAMLDEFRSSEKFDLVTNLDVLEHIQEDEEFIADLKKFLVPQGYVLVTVPAYKFLWSSHDDINQHKRRYTKKELTRKFEHAGYQIIKASYFMFFVSPAFILHRFIQKFTKPKTSDFQQSFIKLPELISRLLIGIVSLESFIIPYVSLPFGTSILVLAKKQ